MRTTRTLALAAVALVALTGCKRRNKPKSLPTHPTAPQPAASDDAAAPEPGPQGEDPKVTARREALQALTTSRDARCPDVVRKLGEDLLGVLSEAMGSDNAVAMRTTLACLKELPLNDALPLLALALDSKADPVRADAVEAAGALRAMSLADKVAERVRDTSIDVRIAACEALPALGTASKASVELLFTKLSDPEDAVRAACAHAFAAAASPAAWREKVAALLLESSAAPKDGALRVLATWRGPAAFDLVRGRLSDPDPYVRQAAITSLRYFPTVAAFRELARFLDDKDVTLRSEAVFAIGYMPPELARAKVFDALRDPEPQVRMEAVSHLARFAEDPEVPLRLRAMLRDDDVGVREAAALGIQTAASPQDFGALLEALRKEKDEGAQVALVEAMILADPPQCVPHFIEQFATAPSSVRLRMLGFLRRQTGQTLPGDPTAWKKWYAASAPADPAKPVPAVPPASADPTADPKASPKPAPKADPTPKAP